MLGWFHVSGFLPETTFALLVVSVGLCCIPLHLSAHFFITISKTCQRERKFILFCDQTVLNYSLILCLLKTQSLFVDTELCLV